MHSTPSWTITRGSLHEVETRTLLAHQLQDVVLIEETVQLQLPMLQKIRQSPSNGFSLLATDHIGQDIQPLLETQIFLSVVVDKDELQPLKSGFGAEENGVEDGLPDWNAFGVVYEYITGVGFVDGKEIGKVTAIQVLSFAAIEVFNDTLDVQHGQLSHFSPFPLYLQPSTTLQYPCIFLYLFLHLLFHFLVLLRLFSFELPVGDEVGLFGNDQFLGLQMHQLRILEIGKDGLFKVGVLIWEANASKGDDPSLSYFFKIIEHYNLAISADDINHLFDLLPRMFLAHALQEEGDVLVGQHPVLVNVDHFECLSDLFVGVELSVDFIPCSLMSVGGLMGDALLLFLGGLLSFRGRQRERLAVLGSVDLYRVEDLLLTLQLIHQALVVAADARNT